MPCFDKTFIQKQKLGPYTKYNPNLKKVVAFTSHCYITNFIQSARCSIQKHGHPPLRYEDLVYESFS